MISINPYLSKLCLAAVASFLSLHAQNVGQTELRDRLAQNRAVYVQQSGGPDLRAKAARLGSDVVMSPQVLETAVSCAICPVPDPYSHPEIIHAATHSDLVVIGKVLNHLSGFTEDNSFVFTDSQFLVSSVWRNNMTRQSATPISGTEITITTPGGTVIEEGHTISSRPSHLLPLRVGHEYLFFLNYIPASHSYQQATLNGFDITGDTVIYLRKTLQPPNSSLLDNKAAFLTAMYSSISKSSQGAPR